MLKRIVFLASGILAANAFGMAQDHITPVEASATSRTVARCRIEEFGVHNALRDIAERAHVVIGLEAVQPEKEETIVLDFPGGTTADLLNLFISQSPDYKWEEVDGGIIRVRRNGGVSLANVSMSYPAMLHQTREEIWESIVRRPEIVAWIDSSHCTREELFSGKEFRNHND